MKKAFALLLAGFTLLAATSGANGQQGVWNIITRPVFEDMLKHRRDSGCQGAFYTYDAFIEAASKFPGFGTTGNDETRRRELAAFFGQTSHETTGGWATAPDGQFAWGYCRVNEQNPTDPPYYGRGPIQLTQ
jgi:chitinase